MLDLYLTESTECWHNTTSIKSAGLSHKKIPSFLQLVKDNLRLRIPRIYKITCKSGIVCIWQMSYSVDTRLKGHQRHIQLQYLNKTAVADCSVDSGHHIQFYNISILTTKTRHMGWNVRVAIEIELHPNNINREIGFCPCNSWKPLIFSLSKAPLYDARLTATWGPIGKASVKPYEPLIQPLFPSLTTTSWLVCLALITQHLLHLIIPSDPLVFSLNYCSSKVARVWRFWVYFIHLLIVEFEATAPLCTHYSSNELGFQAST
jgi:hypothetical protein